MGQNSDWLHLKQMICLIGLVVLSLTGCVKVEVVDLQQNIDSEATSPSQHTPEKHDLAILAVDFEPQLDYEQIVNNPDGVTLLIAVENTGISTETGIQVEAKLLCDEGKMLIVKRSAEILSIAPGETQIVRFTQLPRPPFRPAYQLSVLVVAVDGEANTTNNSRIYDITIKPASE